MYLGHFPTACLVIIAGVRREQLPVVKALLTACEKKHELYPANFGDQSAACTIIDQLFPTDTSSQKVPDGVEVNQQKQQVLNELCGNCSVFLHSLHRYLRASF